jgi:hypothetical protein
MMIALRTTPEEFELNQGWLQHTPSQHRFKFDPDGRVQIEAECNCTQLALQAGQDRALTACFREWERQYWRPLMINSEFAAHFRPRSAFRQLLIDLTARVHHLLIHRATRQEVGAMVPAE